VLSLVFQVNLAIGQTTISPDVQELINQLDQENLSDSKKFELYLAISKKAISKNREVGKEYGEKGLRFAIEHKNQMWQAQSYSNIGIFEIFGGKLNKGDSLLNLAQKNLEDSKKELPVLQAQIYINRGTRLMFMGLFDSSIVYFDKAINLSELANDLETNGKALNNKASSLLYLAKYQTSLITFFDALRISEETANESQASLQLGNIANIYNLTQQYRKSIEQGKKGYELAKRIGNKYVESATLIVIGGSYEQLNILDSALYYGLLGEQLKEELGDPSGIAISKYNLGAVYLKMKAYPEAEDKISTALTLFQKINNAEGIASCQASLGRLYLSTGKLQEGKKLVEEALEIAKKNKLTNAQKDIFYEVSLGFNEAKNFKEAYRYINLHKLLSDSIRIATNLQGLDELQTIYGTEKQKNQIKNLEKDQQLQNLELEKNTAQLKQEKLESERQKNQKYVLYGGLSMLLVFLGFMYHRFRITKRQKNIIESQKSEVETQRDIADNQRYEAELQKEIVEEKNKEIMDSITYAKRLQEAILPPPKLVKEWLTDSFLFYKPKDIVAGDFYWMETVDTELDGRKKTLIFFVAADCTGHGVPGAMVSVVCANALNRSVKEFQLKDPGQVLDKVTELVIQSFEQSEEDIKDGMDIALCALDISSKKLYYSGANNPLWIITEKAKDSENKYVNEAGTHEMIEYKATKQPIGKYEGNKQFVTEEIQLKPGDAMYIFSDGFADQFGGERGKKYKYANFKRFLLANFDQHMDEQKVRLEGEFDTWKRDLEQIDDVCIIGVRINGKERNNFTKRELEVLEYLKEGFSSKMIAEKMTISNHTVDTYRRRLLAKTGTYNATELINYCVEKEVI
jgi:serine phosphatase RsbU (regulator of sigma subunit)/tetratricopeptide (TPR) repeat protein/DNA-binding CsgD family transcriptional regulator